MKQPINAQEWVEKANKNRNAFNFDPEYSLADDSITEADLDNTHVIEEIDNVEN